MSFTFSKALALCRASVASHFFYFLISNILASLVSIFVYRVKMQLNSKSSSRFLSRLSYLSNVNDSPITLQTKYPSKLTGYKACASLRMNYFIS